MKKIQNFLIKILLLLLIMWTILALLRTGNNFSKIFREEIEWINLNDEEKREKIFGDNHNLFRFIETKTKSNSKIVIVSNDMKDYYVARYYLYPRQVFYSGQIQKIELSEVKYDYILVYNVFLQPNKINAGLNYRNIASLYKISK